MIKVELGCGNKKEEGFIGVDIAPGPCVDIVCDLNGRFPFEDDSVDYLRADNSLEHLPNQVKTMNEIYRVCRNGAIVDIIVPSTDGRGAHMDPTHVSFWNLNSFFYYTNKRRPFLEAGRRYGFKGEFKALKLKNKKDPENIVYCIVRLQAVKPVSLK